MVMWFYRASSLLTALILAEKKPRGAEELLKTHKGITALAALAGLVILGFGMVFLIHLGGRFTRRYMNPQFKPPPPNPDQEDWARTPRPPNPKIGKDQVE